jgi:hypothetical protein
MPTLGSAWLSSRPWRPAALVAGPQHRDLLAERMLVVVLDGERPSLVFTLIDPPRLTAGQRPAWKWQADPREPYVHTVGATGVVIHFRGRQGDLPRSRP